MAWKNLNPVAPVDYANRSATARFVCPPAAAWDEVRKSSFCSYPRDRGVGMEVEEPWEDPLPRGFYFPVG